MNKKIIQFPILLIALLLVLPFASNQLHAQTISGLQQPPLDTLDAERVRIWVGIERDSRCRLTINILDDSNTVVRHLVDYLPSRGYYNFYWDKRDDAGERVPSGQYQYIVDNCHKISKGILEVQYSFWEEHSSVSQPDTTRTFAIELYLKADSANVTMLICNGRGRQFNQVCVDSLLNKGRHLLEWRPATVPYRGNYIIKLLVGDYEYRKEVTYIP